MMYEDPIEEYKEKLDLDAFPSSPEVHQVTCPSCSEPVGAKNLNIQSSIAKCDSCQGIFSFSTIVDKLSSQEIIVQDILRPQGVELSKFRDNLDITISQPWLALDYIILAIAPFLLIITMGLMGELLPDSSMKLYIMLAAFSAIALSTLYYFVNRKDHRSLINIDSRSLTIEHLPKKLTRRKQYPIHEIEQVYLKELYPTSTYKVYSIHLIINGTDGQQHIKVLNSIIGRSKARYIEQEIERFLGIKNRRVEEES